MSTYHYLVCIDHRVSGPMLTAWKFGGDWVPGDDLADLIAFRAAHSSCDVRVLDEHAADSYSRAPREERP